VVSPTLAYKAFISYTQGADGKLASILQSALHRFAKPWYRLRALRIFRDQTDLGASPGLWSAIKDALAESEFFLLMASPEGASSKWVRQELEFWISSKGPEKLLIILTRGEIHWDPLATDFDWTLTTGLPTVLAGKFKEEPLHVDLRWVQDTANLSLRHSQFRQSILALAAPLHGRPKSELDGEDVRQFRRTRRLAWSASVALLLLTIASIVASYVALAQKSIAEIQRTAAIQQKRIAETQRTVAIEQRNIAFSRELAAQASQQLGNDPELSLLLATEAAKLKPTEQAEEILRESLVQGRLLRTMRQRWVGHGTVPYIWHVLFSPDGKLILGNGAENVVHVWEAVTGRPVAELAGSTNWSSRFTTVEFSPDSRLILAGDEDSTIRVWEVTNGRMIATVPGQRASFSADSRLLLAIGSNAPVRIADSTTGRILHEFSGGGDNVSAATFCPDNKHWVAGDTQGAVDVRDLTTGKSVARLDGHSDYVNSARFSPDGRLVVTASRDQTVRIWSTENTAPKLILSDHSNAVTEATFTGSGDFVISRGSDERVMVWRVRTGRRVADNLGPLSAAAVSPDGMTLVTIQESKVAKVWNLESQSLVGELRGHEMVIRDVAFSPDGTRLVTGSHDFSVRTWDASLDREVVILYHTNEVSSAVFSPNDKYIVTSLDEDLTAVLWQTKGAFRRAALLGSFSAFSPGGRYLVTGTTDGGLKLIEGGTGPTVAEFANQEDGVGGMIFNQDDRWFGTMTTNYDSLTIWNPRTRIPVCKIAYFKRVQPPEVLASGQTIQQLPEHPTDWETETFSPDGGLVVGATGTNTATVWDIATGRAMTTLIGHTGKVHRALFSPDSHYILTEAEADRPHLWRADTGKLVAELEGKETRFIAAGKFAIAIVATNTTWLWETGRGQQVAKWKGRPITLSPDGRFVATDGGTNSLQVWSTATGQLASEVPADKTYRAAFSPDNKLIVTLTKGSIRTGIQGRESLFASSIVNTWEASTGRRVASWRGHKNEVNSVAFSSDGKFLLTASQDHTARLIPRFLFAPLDELLDYVRMHPSRTLTTEERHRFLHELPQR
jgi:WD40 repeat protein